MSPQQILKFVGQLRDNNKVVERLKVVGGEPLLHPQFEEIYNILADAAEEGLIQQIKIDSNKKTPVPHITRKCKFVRWSGRSPVRKCHLPPLWSPEDHGVVVSPTIRGNYIKAPCDQLRRCGYSLDKYGYLPCSVAIMLVRLLNLNHLYRKDLPDKPWGLEEICKHCSFGMDSKWRNENTKPISKITAEDRTPSPIFQEALRNYNLEEFYKTQQEF